MRIYAETVPGMALLGSRPFGPAPPRAKTFLASSLLAFLETNTEADIVVAVARGEVAALSRTKGRPGVAPGTTPIGPESSSMQVR